LSEEAQCPWRTEMRMKMSRAWIFTSVVAMYFQAKCLRPGASREKIAHTNTLMK